MDIRVNTNSIQNVSNNIDTKREEMLEIYRTQILPALQSSKEYLNVSGLSYDEVIASFNALFGSLDSQLGNFTDTLNSKVIPKYLTSANIVNQLFNKEFADEMGNILTKMNSK